MQTVIFDDRAYHERCELMGEIVDNLRPMVTGECRPAIAGHPEVVVYCHAPMVRVDDPTARDGWRWGEGPRRYAPFTARMTGSPHDRYVDEATAASQIEKLLTGEKA